MQLIDNSNSVYRKGNLIIIAVVYIFSDLIFQGKLSEQFNSFLLNLQHWIITEIFKFRVCFDQQPFHEIFKFVKKSCHDDLNLSFQLPLYVESNSRLLRFFFYHHTKRLAKKKETRVTLLSNRIATHSNNFSWDSLWQHVHTYIEFWLVQWTSVSSVIYFGFALTAFDWQPVYGHLCLFIFVLKKMRISKVLTYKP